MSVRWYTSPTPEAAAEACCHHVIGLLDEALAGQDCATMALSGGKSSKLLFQQLAAASFRWDRVHLFWVDELCVPPSNGDSNYRLAEDLLIRPARISNRNVHRICGELTPERAAKRYIDEIQDFFSLDSDQMPHFDVLIRGMGADAHTASLFPGEPLINDREQIAAAVYVKKLGQWRVTLLPGVMLAAKHNVSLVFGAEKAEAVRAVLQGEYEPMKYPAQVASHHARRVTWFLDQAAAALID